MVWTFKSIPSKTFQNLPADRNRRSLQSLSFKHHRFARNLAHRQKQTLPQKRALGLSPKQQRRGVDVSMQSPARLAPHLAEERALGRSSGVSTSASSPCSTIQLIACSILSVPVACSARTALLREKPIPSSCCTSSVLTRGSTCTCAQMMDRGRRIHGI